ncbi:Tetratricopeptide repeat-containing protein [Streptomyces sp. 2323.1]|uniref:tetratricopeptide repeat protein n=1 Tax=Streptomyces sp. 2323.1 TaxID=1938841 RepID=UPI000BB7B967|nr:tetratricopeptide repeat protein [Streptomyces sp. 2323.1]SOE15078.1 Tetratricopeptide repeat-containing protein [Streptomyces sp. 2323.1]
MADTAVTAVGGFAAGSITHLHAYATPRTPAALPHQVGVIPSRAQSFQYRAEAGQLRAAVSRGSTVGLCQVLTGMGGVGKTQLAADYVHDAWDSRMVDLLVWITASNRTAIVSGYGQAGIELCGADPGDLERAARMFLAWLRAKPYRWLVVLDDVSNPADMRGLWPPGNPLGQTLVTTRRRDAALAGMGRCQVRVGLFSLGEAVGYLAMILSAHGRNESASELAALADDLGCLPLALSQAAAHLIDQALTIAAYRKLLADRTRTLADAVPELDRLPDDQSTTVAAVWSLSVERADQLTPEGLARPLLQLAAMLDPNGIPAAVFTSTPVVTLLAEILAKPGQEGLLTSQLAVTADRIAQSLRVLHRLSLIDHTPAISHRAVRVHALVQRATRDALGPRQRHRYARTVADALVANWSGVDRDTALDQALRANATELANHSENVLIEPEAHEVLYRLGDSLGMAGQPHTAAHHFRHLAALTRRYHGPDHPASLSARDGLAHWRGESGNRASAAAAYRELLADQLRVLGRDDPRTLTTRSNLAWWRGAAGDAAAATTVYESVLADRLRLLGPDHHDTLVTRGNLAHWQGQAGDAVGAAATFKQLLADLLRVLGHDHILVLDTASSLAWWQGRAGDAMGAATGFADVLAGCDRLLGPEHPRTLNTRHIRAYWQGVAGDLAAAVTALEELLPAQVRVLGAFHPYTVATRFGLARWRSDTRAFGPSQGDGSRGGTVREQRPGTEG